MQAKVWGHRVWISLSAVVIVTKTLCPSIHCLFTFPKNYVPPSHCLFTLPKHYGPPIQCLFTKPKLFFPPFHFHFLCYCFGFVIENGGCWKEGHKAADLGILAWRFLNENKGDRRLEQNKDWFYIQKGKSIPIAKWQSIC